MSTRVPDAVKRLFTETFSAKDIAESLTSFDAAASSEDVRRFMRTRGFDVVGIRDEGQVVGYVQMDKLQEGPSGQFLEQFDEKMVFEDTTPLLNVMIEMNQIPFGFVTLFGKVGGIITRSDLQKPPVRMWLFGIVTLIETRFAELIEQHCPEDSWKQYLSADRLQKAQALLEERVRRNQDLQLVDCLQFSDKNQIIARNEDIRKRTIFASRRQAEEAGKRLERLRNNLAHAQDILKSDWSTMIELCEFINHPRA
jgi:hypothetical protein